MRVVMVVWGLAVAGSALPQDQVQPRYPVEVETQASRIFNSTMSPFCPGLLLANCPSPGAAELKEQIREELAAGASPDSVRGMLRATYGSQVEATPPARGFALLAWLVPGVALLGGAVVVTWWLKGRGTKGGPPAASMPVLDAEAEARLERELSEL
jgi:cytochrome c-type biogenesis protein CcmH/NrfF